MISIECIFGAGGSTAGEDLKKSGLFEVIEEPVEPLRNLKKGMFKNLLKDYYKNPEKHAIYYQLGILLRRAKEWDRTLLARPSHGNKVAIRSPYGDLEGYAKYHHEAGNIPHDLWLLYCFVWDSIESWADKCSLFLYFWAPPKVCFERKEKRGRPEEKDIPEEYFEQIGKRHDRWLLGEDNPDPSGIVFEKEMDYKALIVSGEGVEKRVPVIVLDGTREERYTAKEIHELVKPYM